MDKNEELAVLRAERLRAIQNCEFRKARDIDNQLQHLKENINLNTKGNIEREAQAAFDLEREAVMLDAEKAFSEATEQIFAAKNLYQKKMVELQQKHADELQALAENLARDLELATIREVPDSIAYKKQAQASALVQKYDQAEDLFQMSQDTREMTLQERQETVHRQYEYTRQQVIERQNAEDQTCEDMYMKNVENIRRRHHQENERLRKRLEFRAFSLKIPVENIDMPQFNDIELNSENVASNNLNNLSSNEFQSENDVEVVKPKKSVQSAPSSALDNRSPQKQKNASPSKQAISPRSPRASPRPVPSSAKKVPTKNQSTRP